MRIGQPAIRSGNLYSSIKIYFYTEKQYFFNTTGMATSSDPESCAQDSFDGSGQKLSLNRFSRLCAQHSIDAHELEAFRNSVMLFKDEHQRGRSFLIYAARSNNRSAVEILIPHQAGFQDKMGATALIEASIYGSTEVFALLYQQECERVLSHISDLSVDIFYGKISSLEALLSESFFSAISGVTDYCNTQTMSYGFDPCQQHTYNVVKLASLDESLQECFTILFGSILEVKDSCDMNALFYATFVQNIRAISFIKKAVFAAQGALKAMKTYLTAFEHPGCCDTFIQLLERYSRDCLEDFRARVQRTLWRCGDEWTAIFFAIRQNHPDTFAETYSIYKEFDLLLNRVTDMSNLMFAFQANSMSIVRLLFSPAYYDDTKALFGHANKYGLFAIDYAVSLSGVESIKLIYPHEIQFTSPEKLIELAEKRGKYMNKKQIIFESGLTEHYNRLREAECRDKYEKRMARKENSSGSDSTVDMSAKKDNHKPSLARPNYDENCPYIQRFDQQMAGYERNIAGTAFSKAKYRSYLQEDILPHFKSLFEDLTTARAKQLDTRACHSALLRQEMINVIDFEMCTNNHPSEVAISKIFNLKECMIFTTLIDPGPMEYRKGNYAEQITGIPLNNTLTFKKLPSVSELSLLQEEMRVFLSAPLEDVLKYFQISETHINTNSAGPNSFTFSDGREAYIFRSHLGSWLYVFKEFFHQIYCPKVDDTNKCIVSRTLGVARTKDDGPHIIPVVFGKGITAEKKSLSFLGFANDSDLVVLEFQPFIGCIIGHDTATKIGEVLPDTCMNYCATHNTILEVTRIVPSAGHFHCAFDDVYRYCSNFLTALWKDAP